MMVVYILAILVQAAIIVYFVRKGRAGNKSERKLDTGAISYEGVRAIAANVKQGDLQLSIPETQTLVYGVMMDWHMGESILTLVSYITGASNVYLSSGPGITGGGKNPEVGELAARFVAEGQEFLPRAVQVAQPGYPSQGCLRFHLLTNHGLFAAQEKLAHIEDTTSPWLPMFIRGNTVINEMRNGVLA
jgi:hypothetical protein